jgi:hypothetical protein
MRRRHANNRALETLCRFGAGQLGFRPLPRAARLQNRARGHGGRTGLASSGGQLDRQVHHEHATLSLSGFTLKPSSYLQGSRALSAWRRQPPPTTARVSKSSNRHDACGQNHPSIHLRADDACGQMALTWMDGSTKQARKLTKSTRLSVPRAIRAAGTHRGCGDRGAGRRNVFLLVHGSYWEASTLPFARTMMMTGPPPHVTEPETNRAPEHGSCFPSGFRKISLFLFLSDISACTSILGSNSNLAPPPTHGRRRALFPRA